MKIKNIALIVLFLFSITLPVTLSGCIERMEKEYEYHRDVDSGPVVVPDRGADVNVNVETESKPAPDVIHKETSTNTTIERNSETGVQTETRTESTTVH
jgi:hypothetical protein